VDANAGQPIAVVALEAAAVVAARELDHAEHPVGTGHWHDEQVGAHEAADRRRERRLAADERVLLQRLGGGEDELVPVLVVEQEGEPLRGRHAFDVLEDDAQDLGQVEGGRERAQRRVEGA
jgi:hypothetical protein